MAVVAAEDLVAVVIMAMAAVVVVVSLLMRSSGLGYCHLVIEVIGGVRTKRRQGR